MPTSLIVFVAGTVLAGVGVVLAMSHKVEDPVDPDVEERKLVEFVERRPRLAAWVERRLDRTSAGGLLLTVGFVMVLVLAALVGAVFNVIDDGSAFASVDKAIAQYGVDHADARAFDVYALLTRLGGTRVVIAVTALVAAWGWRRYRNPHVAAFMVTVAAGQALLNNGLKLIVERERPDLSQLAPWAGSSFPSGHSAAAAATWAAVAYVLSLESSRTTRALAAGGAAFIAGSVAATRALLGVHWFSDIIAGVAVGFGWFVIVGVAFGGRRLRFGGPRDDVSDPVAIDGRRSVVEGSSESLR